jgi:hypothetical protein
MRTVAKRSGDLFEDLGLPDSESPPMKAELLVKISRVI